ncbi:sensor histidine kinase [Antarcticibacterium sp. 1MA-6-2]|uniref:sensor histidine kinase n=1 Tax=Antarcticibacterium sp. 1MA-6-2 TaxID=2908210 RepID=UPI002105A305|nr:histidine kinase [Antarcticibacterium sp. 1MA-6-2]
MAHIDADKTERMAISLSDLFRHNLNRKNEPYCSLQEEIEAVEAYLKIEQIRFDDRLDYKVDVDDTLLQYLIPRNIIQPLIENAIKHGISNLTETGKIKLEVVQNHDQMEISVYDNGPAFPEDSVRGYGLQSIFDILNLTYKDKAGLSLDNQPEKRVWVSIPITKLKKQNGI